MDVNRAQYLSSNLFGASCAQTRGYTGTHLKQIAGKVAFYERSLSRRFGPAFDQVRISSLMFAEGQANMRGSQIAVTQREGLVIDPGKNPPRELLRKLEFYLAHEYGHVLTLNDKLLWEGIPEDTRKWAASNFNIRQKADLNLSGDIFHLRLFAHALQAGIDNPFVTGLKNEEFDLSNIYMQLFMITKDENLAEGVMDRLLFKLGDLAADRIAVLTMRDTPMNRAVIREDLAGMIGSPEDLAAMEWGAISHAYVRTVAEKTGNAGLIAGYEPNQAGELYQKLYRIFSSLWDSIDLPIEGRT
jgi:hypothetical protein